MIKTNKEVFKFLIKKTNLFSISLSIITAVIWQANLQDNMYLIGGNISIIILFFIYIVMFYALIVLISSTVYLNYFLMIRKTPMFRFLSFFFLSTIGSICILNYNKYNIVSMLIVFFSNLFYVFFYLKFNNFLKEIDWCLYN